MLPGKGLNLTDARKKIANFIRQKVEEANADGVVVGISGGIDSAVASYLSVEALGSRRVLGLIMPDGRVTPHVDIEDANIIADELGILTKFIDIAPIHELFMKNLEPNRLAEGNLRARIRMALLYFYANSMNGLVVGTGDRSEALLGYFCYDSKTRVLTTEGPKYYWELGEGMKVFSMNLETRRVEEVPVQSVHVFDYNGDLMQISEMHVDLLVTPNHRMLVACNHGKGPLLFKAVSKILTSKDISIPLPNPWNGTENLPESVDLSTFLMGSLSTNANQPFTIKTEDFLYLMGLYIGDGTNSVSRVGGIVKSGLSRSEYTSTHRNNLGRFTQIDNPTPVTKTYLEPRIFVASGDGKRSRKPLIELLDRYEINYSRTPTLVAFSNRALSDAFVECGRGAKQKRIPRWALRLPSSALTHLFRGLMDSDGNAAGDAYTTTSLTLAYQMVELCSKLGFGARINWRGPRTSVYKGKEISSSGYYDVRLVRRHRNFVVSGRRVNRVPYSGKVWCPSVPPYENVLVERNGRFVFSGNTKFGDGGVDILPIGDLYKTEVRRMGEILGINRRIITKRSSPRLWPGQTAEGELGMTYETIDSVFRLCLDQKLSAKTVSLRLKMDPDKVKRIVSKYRETAHKREIPEICRIRR